VKWTRVLGAALILLGLAGFLTVADDLRHKGELFGVSTVLASGLVLLAISMRRTRP
jgi:hypothetical protein